MLKSFLKEKRFVFIFSALVGAGLVVGTVFQNCAPASFKSVAQNSTLDSASKVPDVTVGPGGGASGNCGGGPVNWSVNGISCQSTTSDIANGKTQFTTSTKAGTTGNATFICQNGVKSISTSVAASCLQNPPPGGTKINGACGSANNQTLGTAPSAASALCSAGVGTSVTGTGPWNWSCVGQNGGTTVLCSAQKSGVTGDPVNGVCGTANGQTLDVMPTGPALCLMGTSSSVSGTGPWSWSCAGLNGGVAVNCSAQKSTIAPPPSGEACPSAGFPAEGIVYTDPGTNATCRLSSLAGSSNSLPPKDGSRGFSYAAFGAATDSLPGNGRVCLKCVNDKVVLSTNPTVDCQYYTNGSPQFCKPTSCLIPANYGWGSKCAAGNTAKELAWGETQDYNNTSPEATSGTVKLKCDSLSGWPTVVSQSCVVPPTWEFSSLKITYRNAPSLTVLEGDPGASPSSIQLTECMKDAYPANCRPVNLSPSDLDWEFTDTSGGASLSLSGTNWVCIDTGQSMDDKNKAGLVICNPAAKGAVLAMISSKSGDEGHFWTYNSVNGYVPDGSSMSIKATIRSNSAYSKYAGRFGTFPITMKNIWDYRITFNQDVFSNYGGIVLAFEVLGANGWMDTNYMGFPKDCQVLEPAGVSMYFFTGTYSWHFNNLNTIPSGGRLTVKCTATQDGQTGSATFSAVKP